jgi:chromate reductase, NAD(P)H dehydrogenase (quinone)
MLPHLLCISGSVRNASSNTALLQAMAEVSDTLAILEIYDGLAALPIFNPDLDGACPPLPVADLKRRIEASDGLIIACPEYVHGIPGGFKNMIDWLVSGEEFCAKPVMLVHANGHGRGEHVRAQLADVLATAGADLREPDGISIYLLSRTAEEIEAALASPASREAMRTALHRFASGLTPDEGKSPIPAS